MWVWTAVAALWWCASLCVVKGAKTNLSRKTVAHEDAALSLTIFKPLPGLRSEAHRDALAAALESFFVQLDSTSELLIAIPQEDAARWEPILMQWRQRFPEARWSVVAEEAGDVARDANPKIAWQRRLAACARGELWLWSDADVVAPAGYLQTLRAEWAARGNARMITSPYIVRRMARSADFFDAAFVNVELYPGVRWMARQGAVRFGLGAGMLFARTDFERIVKWDEMGSALADDFMLGNALGPARVSGTTVETFASTENIAESLGHYLRWQKTIRWCRPDGFAAQLAIVPVLGWVLCLLFLPEKNMAWCGLAMTVLAESCWAMALMRRVGCRVPLRLWMLLPVWSVVRAGSWLACWLPWPVRWAGRWWWKARANF